MSSPYEEAITRIIALCQQGVREVLTSHECQSALLSTVDGLQWQITVSRHAFEQLLQHESLETMIGAGLAVAPIQAVVLTPPADEPVVVIAPRFAHRFKLHGVLDQANSNDDRALADLAARLRTRCSLVRPYLSDVVIVMDAHGRYLEIDGKAPHLVADRLTIQGKVLEAVLPAALCVRWRYFLGKALLTPGRSYSLSYTLQVKGLQRSYRAKFTGYGGDAGEVLILVKEVSAWLRR